MIPIVVPMQLVSNTEAVPVAVAPDGVAMNMSVSMEYVASQYDDYEGDYIFTPGDREIVIGTADMHLAQNIVISPVPNSYGRITYNGSAITVY